MSDVASLGFAIDSKQLISASDELKRFTEIAKRTGETVEQTQARFRAADQERIKSRAVLETVNAATNRHISINQKLANDQKLATAVSRQATIAQAELGDKVELLSRNTDEAYRSLSTRSFFRLLAREASLVGGPLGNLIQHFGILGVGGQRLGIGITVGTIAISALIAAVIKAITTFVAFESAQSRIGNTLQLTNQASGQTAVGLEKMAQKFAATGLVSLSSIREAQAELLKFKEVGANSFERVLSVAVKLSLTGMDLKDSVKAVAEALKDQSNANKALEGTTIQLNASQRSQIDTFLRMGKVSEANLFILDILEEKTRNLTQSNDDIATSFGKLGTSLIETFQDMGKVSAEAFRLKAATDAITQFIKYSIDLRKLQSGGPAAIGKTPGGFTPRGNVSTFAERFDTSDIAASSANMAKLAKSMADVKKELEDQSRVAGMSAVQQEMYNQTVLRGIPANTEFAASIRKMVQSNAAINETRAITDQIKTQTASLQIETATLTMAVGPATAYRVVQEALAQARIKNIELSPRQIALIEEEGRALAKAATEAQKFRQLKEFVRDATDFNKQMDSLAVNGINAVSSGLTDILMGTKSVKEGFRDMALAVIRMIEEMIIKMLIARAIQASFGGFFGASSGGPGPWQGPPSALGNVFDQGGLVPFAKGGIVTRPTIFPFAKGGVGLMGESGAEAIIPLKRGPGGELGVRGGGGVTVNIENNYDFRNAAPETEARMRAYVDMSSRQTVQAAVQAVAKTRSNDPGYMRN